MYLSSFRMGAHPEQLVALLDDSSGRSAVIANAIDHQPAGIRREGVERELTALAELGIDAYELDLRDYFGAADRLAADLADHRLVWVRGGNIFMLRHALAHSGGDEVLRDQLHGDALVYAGYSAGPCVLGPSLRGLELVDETGPVAATYAEPVIWAGLGVIDFAFVPHYESAGHPETEDVGRVAERYRREGVPHQTLRDGEALVVDGDNTTLL